LRTVVVDAANVVGSRPDGWWRDRAGAAVRLHADLAKLAGDELAGDEPDFEFVLVVEGAAKAARFEQADGVRVVLAPGYGVRVVLAPGSGDDTIAALAGEDTLVVTADRELRRRCEQRGAEVVGPGWLLRQFEG
jgi:hypothetical protein